MKRFLLSIAALAAVSTFTWADETVTDICGNTYPVVTIGEQTWMSESLKCNRYDNQSEAHNATWLTNNTLPTSDESVYTPYFTDATDKTKWSSTQYAGNLSSEQIAKLGYLYNWAAAVGVENGKEYGTTPFTGNRQGICPNGWHVPSLEEWQTLYDYIYNAQGLSSNAVGKYLKTTSGWHENGNGTDSYGFAALPSGYAEGSSVKYVGSDAGFWTATPVKSNDIDAYGRYLNVYDLLIDWYNYSKDHANGVRCVKNKEERCNASDYAQVTIGTQVWMAENYACSKYDTESEAYNAAWLTNNTVPTSSSAVYTPYYTDATDKTNWKSTEYSDKLSTEQIAKLGYLYNWSATMGVQNGQDQTSAFTGNRQGICPNGWHIPTRAEWQTLYEYIYADQALSSNEVGKSLKTTSGWYQNGNGTDIYGFAAMPSGNAYGSSVYSVGYQAYFWTATPNENNNYNAYYRYLLYCNDILYNNDFNKYYGQSVRCVKNTSTAATEAEADAATITYKVIENGQVVIVKGDRKFNLQGVEIK